MSAGPLGIVLGLKLNEDGSPRRELAERLEKASEHYFEGRIDRMVLTGGNRADVAPVSEAEAMRRYLTNLGVRDDAIVMEEKALDTFGNAAFSRRIADRLRPSKVVAFTSSYHVRRTRLIFGKVFGDRYMVEVVGCGWDPNGVLYVLSGNERVFYSLTKKLLRIWRSWREIIGTHPLYSEKGKKMLGLPDERLARRLGINEEDASVMKRIMRKELKRLGR